MSAPAASRRPRLAAAAGNGALPVIWSATCAGRPLRAIWRAYRSWVAALAMVSYSAASCPMPAQRSSSWEAAVWATGPSPQVRQS
ncbi:MAG: hypothetical protein LBC97_07630 [Bifidobacteriaceae bacterium]|nr:hypothetical protein [Bifidobacteriaceae bacterium]